MSKDAPTSTAPTRPDEAFAPLRAQLLDAACHFAPDAVELSEFLAATVDDVERAMAEPLEIMPVCHHSPASALHMAKRLRSKRPRVIYMELCEDLRPLVEQLPNCKLPVAFQAFAGQSEVFPPDWTPLIVVAPTTHFSAEYQAMAYALENDVELVFVDRSVDHIFQRHVEREEALSELMPEDAGQDDDDENSRGMHGRSLGLRLGDIEPTYDAFLEVLLRNARVQHFSEWMDQYVEQALLRTSYEAYRHIMCLLGSQFRRLGERPERLEELRWRERYMWTRIKEHMRANDVDPEEAMFICGASHAVPDVEEYGILNDAMFEIPARTDTKWSYGLIPSSYLAIEYQFAHAPGTVSQADRTWKKGLEILDIKPFDLKGKKTSTRKKTKAAAVAPADTPEVVGGQVLDFFRHAPNLEQADEAQLIGWCADIVALARKNGYLATTADSIAIYQTATLLAGLRNRRHPSPYDFRDAAITCLEKNRVPKRRDIAWLCDILLGGDRSGTVGYDSLPPLAQDVHDRLAGLPINIKARTIQRALMDFREHPEWRAASDLLWKLHFLLGGYGVVRPIMGQRTLGHTPVQESWDILIGKHQRPLIELGYEGVTVEQVIEGRLKRQAFGPQATALAALDATEKSMLLLQSRRLTEELGLRAVELLAEETTAKDAPAIFDQVRGLVHHYRATPGGLAPWIERFVATGYAHYATLLPAAFADGDTSPEEISGMLAFVFTLESLALALGCDRSQLHIAMEQTADLHITLDKQGLLWAAQSLLGTRDLADTRAWFDRALDNPMLIAGLPAYIGGFVQALRFAPQIDRLIVEFLSKAFARLPDEVLIRWIPSLLMTLRPLAAESAPAILKQAARCFPGTLDELEGWEFPWEKPPKKAPDKASTESTPGPELTFAQRAARTMLEAHPETTDSLAALLGLDAKWITARDLDGGSPDDNEPSSMDPGQIEARRMLDAYPDTLEAVSKL